jgi:ubiquinone/menaquinone biosynthesis C-methylase UbiE
VEGRAPSPQETWDEVFGDYYLRAFAVDEQAAATEAAGAARLTGAPAGGDLLDVPCGFGRHAVALAAAGFRVTGVDRSEPLLAEARRRAGDADWPQLVNADYRDLPFADASFDGALNLFSSLGYLGDEEDTQVLAEVARVLRPGGRLVIETMHRDYLVHAFQETDWRRVGEGRLLLEQRAFDPASGVLLTTQTLIEGSGSRESRTFSQRVYAATELVAMLRRAGFAEVRCSGGLDGAPLGLDTRLVVVATR